MHGYDVQVLFYYYYCRIIIIHYYSYYVFLYCTFALLSMNKRVENS